MRHILVIILTGVIALSSIAQTEVAFHIVSLPDNHPENDPIYFAGSVNGWDPGDPEFELAANADGTYQINVSGSGTIAFKFTRGDWAKVEGDADGEEIPDRTYTFSGTNETKEITIESWKDLEGNGGVKSTAAENVQILGEFYSPQLNTSRRIWVYLPPDYDQSSESYPVVYMHDGQNIFDVSTSFVGEWSVDETLNELYEERRLSLIVIGIDHGGNERINEYCPWINPQYGGGKGEAYVDFIVNTLKPQMDEQFRTLTDRENTAIIGSSLGGLISYYAALKHPTVFSRVGALSPAYWINPEIFQLTDTVNLDLPIKLYMSAGSQEPGSVAQNISTIKNKLIDRGNDPALVKSEVHQGYGHNETYWKSIFDETISWLFESSLNEIELGVNNEKIRWWINQDTLIIQCSFNCEDHQYGIYDLSGKLLKESTFNRREMLSVSDLTTGVYLLRLRGAEQLHQTVKFRIK